MAKQQGIRSIREMVVLARRDSRTMHVDECKVDEELQQVLQRGSKALEICDVDKRDLHVDNVDLVLNLDSEAC
ncbi:hypothetical protein L916_11877 [Phytophthora nicotianae]|uniref:Uncharacterized protein n=1 Tax=Phytophthora nicotianae TaxID=4792 RepID=W2IPU2_PHYNI|nr:hypothetical protein L916_11877 [Phytophthora nicotianae]